MLGVPRRSRVLVCESIAGSALDYLRQHVEVELRTGMSAQELKAAVADYDALLVRSQTRVTGDIIEAAGRLQIIGRPGVGVDNIDLDAATRRGVLVINSPEGNIVSTAEHTIAMLMALARKIPAANAKLHFGLWDRSIKGREIRNKVLGIIGLGRVGRHVADLSSGLHMNVIAYDPMISESVADKLGVRMVDLDSLLRQSDFVTVHVPINPSTRGLIGARELGIMQTSAAVINCARGGIVDETALYEALESGQIAGAAVDVFSKEPAQDNILLRSDKVIATPHLAASTVEAETSAGMDVAEQIVSVLRGFPPKSPVNAPMVSAELMSVLAPYMEVGATIGSIGSQMVEGHLVSLTIHYEGEIAEYDTTPVKAMVLSGLLSRLTDERITIVNADLVARGRGIPVTEAKDPVRRNYSSMVTLEAEATGGITIVAGTCLRGATHLTRVNNYWLQIEPTDDYMLFTEHKDRPGMIGTVGSIIGNAGINISQMQVSRGAQPGGKAMMAMCLSSPPPDDVHQSIMMVQDLYRATVVKLAK
jgi:D-3-phosphoglycerate dehydrogenase